MQLSHDFAGKSVDALDGNYKYSEKMNDAVVVLDIDIDFEILQLTYGKQNRWPPVARGITAGGCR